MSRSSERGMKTEESVGSRSRSRHLPNLPDVTRPSLVHNEKPHCSKSISPDTDSDRVPPRVLRSAGLSSFDCESERADSSLASWGDEYDRTAARKVADLFSKIDSALYDGTKLSDDEFQQEIEDWRSAFPHLRVRGCNVLRPGVRENQRSRLRPAPPTVTINATSVYCEPSTSAHDRRRSLANGSGSSLDTLTDQPINSPSDSARFDQILDEICDRISPAVKSMKISPRQKVRANKSKRLQRPTQLPAKLKPRSKGIGVKSALRETQANIKHPILSNDRTSAHVNPAPQQQQHIRFAPIPKPKWRSPNAINDGHNHRSVSSYETTGESRSTPQQRVSVSSNSRNHSITKLPPIGSMSTNNSLNSSRRNRTRSSSQSANQSAKTNSSIKTTYSDGIVEMKKAANPRRHVRAPSHPPPSQHRTTERQTTRSGPHSHQNRTRTLSSHVDPMVHTAKQQSHQQQSSVGVRFVPTMVPLRLGNQANAQQPDEDVDLEPTATVPDIDFEQPETETKIKTSMIYRSRLPRPTAVPNNTDSGPQRRVVPPFRA